MCSKVLVASLLSCPQALILWTAVLTGHLGGLPGQLLVDVALHASHDAEGLAQGVGHMEQHFTIVLGQGTRCLRAVDKHLH